MFYPLFCALFAIKTYDYGKISVFIDHKTKRKAADKTLEQHFLKEFKATGKNYREFELKQQSKAPVSQLVNADDTSVIEIKTATDTSLKAKRNYIFARLCNEK